MSTPIEDLQRTIAVLRAPGGCPWDRKQTLEDAARYLLDEAGALLDAALERDRAHVAAELRGLLFMVSFCARILGEEYPADFQEVARLGNEKLVRRHPHVFGDVDPAADSAESQVRWNEIKAAEKMANGEDPAGVSLLKDLPASSAPLHQAHTYQENAAEVGFDWPDLGGVWDKLAEEEEELRRATDSGDAGAMEHEVGDLLFSVVNLSRRLGVQPDLALRRANRRFRERFHLVEATFDHSPARLREASLDDLEAAWRQAKSDLQGDS